MLLTIYPSLRVTWHRPKMQRVEPVQRHQRTEEERIALCTVANGGINAALKLYRAKKHGLVHADEFTKNAPRCSLPRCDRLKTRGRNRLRDGAAVLELQYPRHGFLAFDTYTWPPEYDEQHTAHKISAVIRLFLDKLRYHYRIAGCRFEFQYVIEMHPKRSVDAGRYIPHVHMLRTAGIRQWQPIISKGLIAKLWSESVEQVYGFYAQSFLKKASTQTTFVKKSVRAYMGKYLSKNKSETPASAELQASMPLKRYWGMSRNVLKYIRQNTRYYRCGGVRWIVEQLLATNEFYYNEISIDLRLGYQLPVGGIFTPKNSRICGQVINFVENIVRSG